MKKCFYTIGILIKEDDIYQEGNEKSFEEDLVGKNSENEKNRFWI